MKKQSTYFKKIDCFLKKIKKLFDVLYNFATVISSFAIFLGVVLFLIGVFSGNNQSDNNLVMKQIKEEAEDGEITSIRTEDIHGFGYNSVLVTIGNKELLSQDKQNRFIVMDTVENEILKNMNDLWGLKSNYKVTFSYKLRSDKIDLHPRIDYVFDMIDGQAKEIIIKYNMTGHEFAQNYYYVAIFKYSYENERYEIIGTYPICEKLNLTTVSEEGNIKTSTRISKEIFTDFKNFDSNKEVMEFYDEKGRFNLTGFGTTTYLDYWISTKRHGNVLVIIKVDTNSWNALVNCYQPSYNKDSNELSWNAIFSENVKISSSECEHEVLQNLKENLKDNIELLER